MTVGVSIAYILMKEKKRLVEKLNKQLAEGGISGILVPEGFCDYTSPGVCK